LRAPTRAKRIMTTAVHFLSRDEKSVAVLRVLWIQEAIKAKAERDARPGQDSTPKYRRKRVFEANLRAREGPETGGLDEARTQGGKSIVF
jgi:hypothetical protein